MLLLLHAGTQAPECSLLSRTSSQACIPGNRALGAGVTKGSVGSLAPPHPTGPPWASYFPTLKLDFRGPP